MSNLPSNLDLIAQNQSQKEATANALFTAASPAMIYGRREQTSAGLVWGFFGGVLKTGAGHITIPNGVVSLNDEVENFVEARLDTGAVEVVTGDFTAGRLALYKVTVSGGVATGWVDYRQALLGAMGDSALAFTDLTDTPANYTGQEGKVLAVNSAGTGVEFVDGSSGGAVDFIELEDTPASYTGQAGKIPAVNNTEDGLEFIDLPEPPEPPEVPEKFTDLTDTPANYTGQEGKFLVVNDEGTGLEFINPTPPAIPTDFIELDDTPASYIGAGNKILSVKSDESGLEFIDATGGGAGFLRAYDDTNEYAPDELYISLRAGLVRKPDGTVEMAGGTAIGLNDDATNYVEVWDNAGFLMLNSSTTGWTPGRTPLWEVVCSGGFVVSKTDKRPTFTMIPETGGGGGVSDFIDLDDTPASYTGQAGKIPAVNNTEDGLEFIDAPSGGGISEFTELEDTPTSYIGQAGKVVAVNNTEDGLEFITAGGGGGSDVDWVKISNDYTSGTQSQALANESMAIGPGAETQVSGGLSLTPQNLGSYGEGLNGYVTFGTAHPFSVGQTVEISGFPPAGPQTVGNYGLWDLAYSDQVTLASSVAFKVGELVTVANSPNPAVNGDYIVVYISGQQLQLGDGFNVTDADLTGATFTGWVDSPNGSWEIYQVYTYQINLLGFNFTYYSVPPGALVSSLGVGQSLAIGAGAIASADRAVALGYGSLADRANTVMVGGRKLGGLINPTANDEAVTLQYFNNNQKTVETTGMTSGTLTGTPTDIQYHNIMYQFPNSGAFYDGKIVVFDPSTGDVSSWLFSFKAYLDASYNSTVSGWVLTPLSVETAHEDCEFEAFADPGVGWKFTVANTGAGTLKYSITTRATIAYGF